MNTICIDTEYPGLIPLGIMIKNMPVYCYPRNLSVKGGLIVNVNLLVEGTLEVDGDIVAHGSLDVGTLYCYGKLRVHGNLVSLRNSIVHDDSDVYGYEKIGEHQEVKGSQRVGGYQEVGRSQIIRGNQTIEKYQKINQGQRIYGRQKILESQEVHGEQLITMNQSIHGYQSVQGLQDVHGTMEIFDTLTSFSVAMSLGKFMVYFTKEYIQIGCELHSVEEWLGFSEDQTNRMGFYADDWRYKWREFVISTHSQLVEIHEGA